MATRPPDLGGEFSGRGHEQRLVPVSKWRQESPTERAWSNECVQLGIYALSSSVRLQTGFLHGAGEGAALGRYLYELNYIHCLVE